MKTKFFFITAILFAFQIHSQNNSQICAQEKINQAMEAFGGPELLNSIRNLKIKGVGHRLMREQSERPEGPYIVDYFDLEVIKDLENDRLQYSQQFKLFDVKTDYRVNDTLAARDFNGSGRWFPVVKTFELDQALAPERILQTALAAGGLKCESEVLLQKIPHDVVSFHYRARPVKIFINKNTHLITAVEIIGEYKTNNYHVWGDIPARIYYSMYSMEKNNLVYPHQMDIYLNGEASENIMLLSLEQNVELTDNLKFPDAAKDLLVKYYGKDLSSSLAADKAIKEEEGILIIPGSWYTTIIEQEDGLVILEAPISSKFADQIQELALKLFPGQKIKSVVSTSSAWPHVGGLRPFIAKGIPVVHSELNSALLNKIAAADFTTNPDKQQKLRKKIKSVPVSEKLLFGKGQNRMVIYPLNSEASEGMMMVYFPEHKLLYTTDLVQNLDFASQPLFREYAHEILQAIEREQLEVEKIYGMHLSPVGLEEFKNSFDNSL